MSPLRVHLCFALFVLAMVALVARVSWLQIGGVTHARARVERQKQRRVELPAQRGTIVDRDERVLACDRQVLEARAEIAMRVEDRTQPGLPMDRVLPWLDEIVRALTLDPELRPDARKRLADKARQQLFARVLAAAAGHVRETAVRSGQREIVIRRVEILVANEVCSTAVVDALHALERRRDSSVRFTFVKGWRRSYPEREVTIGPVGFVSDLDLDAQGNPRVMRGIEQIAGLLPGDDGARLVDRDARANAYWTLAWTRPDAPSVVHTTLDLPLQKAAQELLAEAAAKVKAKYDTEPDWGALMLVEIETGAVRAMASWQAKVDPKAARFAPTQCVYQPGSVVKPLVFALALERGVLREDDLIDCTPNAGGLGYRIAGRTRPIHDVHATHGAIPPHDILVRSSNIGAFQVGMRLGRDGLDEYLARAGFGRRTDLKLPHELAGRRPSPLKKPEREFLSYTGPSISIGYEIDATPAQLTRAFLTLLSGRARELRLFEAIDDDAGVRMSVPVSDAGSARYLSEDTVAWIRRTLCDVVSDEPHSTGHELFRQLKELGITKGVIAGKTGTSERTAKDGSWVRSATFAGFAPVDAPRWLAVCVLQKERANLFYGGLYAAPAAGRLLLAALGAELRHRQRVDAQVSAQSIERGGQTPFAIQGGR